MNEVEIVVTSSDRSDAGLKSAESKVDALKRSAIKKIEEINAKEIRLNADITQAEIKLAELKKKAESASGDAKVKVDADIASATARLDDLRRQLAAIPDAKAKVDLDTSDAIRKINEVRSKADDSFRQRSFSITANTSGAIAAVGALIAILGAVGPAVVAAAGALAGLGAGAAVGAGAAAAGFVGIGDALTAMSAKATSGGGAVAASASQIRSATRSVEDAERSLKAAQEDAKASQEALSDARRDAAAQLEEYRWQTEEMALSEEGAAISVERAKERLRELDKDGKASALDYREARHRVAEAEFRAGEVSRESTKLAAERNDAERKGVEGSDQVVAAKKKIQQTEEQVRVATERLADSQLALAEAMKPKGGGGGQVDKLAEAFAKLGPNAREFATFLRGFIDKDLSDLRKAGQEAFLPGVQKGLQELRPMMREITPAWAEFSQITGEALGGMIPLLGRLAPSVLEFGRVSLQGLSPLKGEITAFSTAFSQMVDRVSDTGVAQQAMGQFAGIIGQLLGVIPPLIEYGLKLMATMGPDLQQSFANIGTAAANLGDAFLEFAPTAGDLLVSVTGLLGPLTELLGWLINLNPTVTGAAIAVAAGAAAFLKLQAAAIVTKTVLGDLGASFGLVRRGADDVGAATSKMEGGAGKLRGALGSVSGLLGGPWGAAVAVGTVVVGALAAKHAEAARQVEELTSALRSDSGAIGENTRAKVVNQLETDGVLEKARALGLSLEDVTLASLGNVDAAARVNAALDQQAAALTNTGGAWQVAGRGAHAGADALQQFEGKAGTVRDAINGQNESLSQARDQFQRTAEAMGQSADQAGQLGGQLDSATEATRRLRDEQAQAANGLLGLRGSETNYYEALSRTREALQQNGATLSVHSAKGLANRDALDAMARAANDYLLKIQENEGEGPKFDAVLAQSRAALSRAAQQMGMSKAAADQFAAAVIAIPSVKNTKITADTAQAMGALRGVQTAIANINGKTVTIRTVQETVYISSGNGTRIAKSSGGRIPGSPSRVDSVPAMLAPGEYVVNADAASKHIPLLEAINSGVPLPTQTARMPSGGPSPSGGGGPTTVLLEVVSGGSQLDDLLVEILRHAVRVRGGDVQVVLGR